MALLLCPEMITALVDVDSCRKILVTVILKLCVTLSLRWKHECFTICVSWISVIPSPLIFCLLLD